MQDSEFVFCPYCGQQLELAMDVSVGSHSFTTDCEVCCRPYQVELIVRNGEVTEVTVHA